MGERLLASDEIQSSPNKKRVAALATNNATLVKSAQGNVYGWALSNNTASVKVVKFYDNAALPVPGTTAVAFTIMLPANSLVHENFPIGIPFSNGIGFAIVTTVPDGTNTATAADDVHGVLLWK
jgi:hypothetical protein